MRVSVVKILKQRKRDTTKKYNNGNNTINFNTFRSSQHTRHKAGRLCGDLEIFQKDFLTKGDLKNPKACEVCVIDSYTKYIVCTGHRCTISQKYGQKTKISSSIFTVINSFG